MKMEHICKNCKYWERVEIEDEGDRIIYHEGMCNNKVFIITGEKDDDQLPIGGIRIDTGDIRTDENYGCIHFESKEEKDG